MTADQVRKAREQAHFKPFKPFKPFTLFLSDQRRFEIRHPDFLWLIPGGRTVAVADENGAVDIMDLVPVTSLRTNGSDGTR